MTNEADEQRAAFEAWAGPAKLRDSLPLRDGDSYAVTEVRWAWEAWQAALSQRPPAAQAGTHGFSRDDLACIAEGLEKGYERTVNVGNTTGEGDEHLESTTAAAARFIRTALAASEPSRERDGGDTAEGTAARAFEIADEAMFELLHSEAVPCDSPVWDANAFGLVGENCEEVTTLAAASSAIREAFDWLRARGYVELGTDGVGAYIRVIRRPAALSPPPVNDGGDTEERFADELLELLADEDLTDDKLRAASEDLLPRLHDWLRGMKGGDTAATDGGKE